MSQPVRSRNSQRGRPRGRSRGAPRPPAPPRVIAPPPPPAVSPYEEITRGLEHAIWRAFGQANGTMLWTSGDEHNSLVKDVDNWACAFEARHIMPSKGEHWEQAWLLKSATRPIPEHEGDEIHGWEWREARDTWTAVHHELVLKATQAAVAA